MPAIPGPAADDASEAAAPTLDELHAEFVTQHVETEPGPLPVGAAEDVAATVDHLRAAVEVRDVFDAVAAEGRVVTDDERIILEESHEVLVTGPFTETPNPDAS